LEISRITTIRYKKEDKRSSKLLGEIKKQNQTIGHIAKGRPKRKGNTNLPPQKMERSKIKLI
jgi:hypothetical protein